MLGVKRTRSGTGTVFQIELYDLFDLNLQDELAKFIEEFAATATGRWVRCSSFPMPWAMLSNVLPAPQRIGNAAYACDVALPEQGHSCAFEYVGFT
jgi:hypothetical protein